MPLFAALILLTLKGQGSPSIQWRPSFGAAMEEAAQSGKVLMLNFYSDRWSVCERMDQTTFRDPAVARIVGKMAPARLRGDSDNADLAKKYGVTGYPTVVFVDKEGSILGEIVGFESGPQFCADASLILDNHEHADKYLKRLNANPSDAVAAELLAAGNAKRGNIEEALKLLGSALHLDPKNDKGNLCKALNAIGDYYTELQRPDWDTASSYFEKTRTVAKDQVELVHACEKLAQCWIFTGKSAKAILVAKQALAVKGLDGEDRKDLESLLESAKEQVGHSGDRDAADVGLVTGTA